MRDNKFFIDTEFIEDGVQIRPLAIAVVYPHDMGNDVFYGIITDTDRSLANNFVKENVLPHVDVQPDFAKCVVGERATIALSLFVWVYERSKNPEFWADYGAYDWVMLCQLFGSMEAHPSGWPMFINDIQQIRPPGLLLPEPELKHHAVYDAMNVKDCLLFINNRTEENVNERSNLRN